MNYKKPSKEERNALYLMNSGFSSINALPFQEETFDLRKKFLILCEGDNTEYEYFKSFPVPSNTVKVIGGKGSKNTIINHALKLKEDPTYKDYEFWCVYDFDVKADERETQLADFNSSIEKAKASNIHVAWSNDCFELWFLLHFQYLDTSITRSEIYKILKQKWGLKSFHNESKTVDFCKTLYELHGGDKSIKQQQAIKYAKKLHKTCPDNGQYADHCPCTTVYQLVEELNKYIKV